STSFARSISASCRRRRRSSTRCAARTRASRAAAGEAGTSRGPAGSGGGGVTFEAPGSLGLSAAGTEAFKQDFAKWEEMRRQATQALDTVDSALSKKIQAKQAKDPPAPGPADNP